MEFLSAYKRLDNLCRDMNGTGVTGYIQDMERTVNGTYRVAGWKEDYFQLKHYRYIRNRIVHENDADESNMCSGEDVRWIENFHQRILTQNDPLALYHHNVKPYAARKTAPPAVPPTILTNRPYISNKRRAVRPPAGCAVAMLSVMALAVLALVVLFF